MRVFWHDGGLQILPETPREGQLLVELLDKLKFGKPPEMLGSIPGGETTSSGESLYRSLVGNHQPSPSGFTGERDHKEHVIRIDKLPKVVTDLNG